jgi:riboflavin kinase/FMN adenylyltransferase
MIIVQDPQQAPAPEGLAVALGNFDGLHLGHRTLLSAVRSLADEHTVPSAMLTFYPHTGELLRGENRILYPERQKKRWIEDTGQIDYWIRLTFDRARRQQTAADFFETMLRQTLAVRGVVIGEDFRFGYRGEGDAEMMKKMCRQAGLACRVIPQVYADGEIVSSTRVRRLVQEGRMEEAGRLLVRPYTLLGVVVPGEHLGSRWQVPTVNLTPESDQVIPRHGVYVSRTCIGDRTFPSVTNVGYAPTVGGTTLRAETHLLDVSMDLYGQEVEVELLHFLRPEQCFENTEALKAQLSCDIQATRRYFT